MEGAPNHFTQRRDEGNCRAASGMGRTRTDRFVLRGVSIMKKLFGSLPFRLLLGIAVGILCGLVFSESVMKVIVTL